MKAKQLIYRYIARIWHTNSTISLAACIHMFKPVTFGSPQPKAGNAYATPSPKQRLYSPRSFESTTVGEDSSVRAITLGLYIYLNSWALSKPSHQDQETLVPPEQWPNSLVGPETDPHVSLNTQLCCKSRLGGSFFIIGWSH